MKSPTLALCFLFLHLPACQSNGSSVGDLESWHEYAQRPALQPVMNKDFEVKTLGIASSGDYRCNGAWKKSVPVQPGKFYRFHAEYRTQDVDYPRRSILAKIDWKNREGKRVEWPEYPELRADNGSGWRVLEDIFQVPPRTATADLELIFRWDESGRVEWKNVSFGISSRPARRVVKLAGLNYRHRDSSGPEENRKAYGKYVEEAGKAGVDILCLPEGITLVGTGKSYLEVGEPVPGPTTEFLGKLARKHGMYIVAGLIETEGETAYNTAVMIGKDGKLAGKYRKVSLPREEIEGGLTPGDAFPAFDTEFGKIGILICWDIHFPEGPRRLAYQGAEIILLPIWGGIEPLFPARAIENQIVLVTSSYDATTGIWNERGEMLAKAEEEGKLAIAEVDLAEEIYWEWLGNFRARIPREAPVVAEIDRY